MLSLLHAFDRRQEKFSRHNNLDIGVAQVFLRAVDDRSHTLLDRMILIMISGDAGESLSFLNPAIDQPILVLVPQLSKIRRQLSRSSPFGALVFLDLGSRKGLAREPDDPVVRHRIPVIHGNKNVTVDKWLIRDTAFRFWVVNLSGKKRMKRYHVLIDPNPNPVV